MKSEQEKRAVYLRSLDMQERLVSLPQIALSILFCSSLAIDLVSMHFYRSTIIPFSLALSLFLAAGTAIFIGVRAIAGIVILDGHVAAEFFLEVTTAAGFLLAILLITNSIFSESKLQSLTVDILSTGKVEQRISKYCEEPYAIVQIGSQEKQVHFPCRYDLSRVRQVRLSIQRGFWGFDVIRGKEAVE